MRGNVRGGTAAAAAAAEAENEKNPKAATTATTTTRRRTTIATRGGENDEEDDDGAGRRNRTSAAAGGDDERLPGDRRNRRVNNVVDYDEAGRRRDEQDGGGSGVRTIRRRDPTNLFSSLFFGGWMNSKNAKRDSSDAYASYNENDDDNRPPAAQAVPSRRDDNRGGANGTTTTSTSAFQPPPRSHTKEARMRSAIEGASTAVASQVDRLIPVDESELRRSAAYRSAYKAIQWQRDNYLVGMEYANWRKKERERLSRSEPAAMAASAVAIESTTTPIPAEIRRDEVSKFQREIVYDRTALGHQQIAKLATWFVPSETVKKALLPLIVPLPTGALYPITQRSVVNVILGQQDTLDRVVKNQLLRFLQNPNNRAAIKNETTGKLATWNITIMP